MRWPGSIAETEQRRQQAVWRSKPRSLPKAEIRDAKKTIKTADAKLEQVRDRFETLAEPHRESLRSSLSSLEATKIDLKNRTHDRAEWLAAHPDTTRRLDHLDRELSTVNRALTAERDVLDGIETPTPTNVGRRSRTVEQELVDNLPAPEPAPLRDPWAQFPSPHVDHGIDRGFDGPDLGF